MSLSVNLAHSKNACQYVLDTVKLKGANWDQYRGAPTSYERCMSLGGTTATCTVYKDSVDICLYDDVRPKVRRLTIGVSSMIDQIRIIADESKSKKCGNCGEFSALAFIYLYDSGVRPLDWMSLIGGDHAFVVIGRENSDPNDHRNWGAQSVICDPWGRGFRHGDVRTGTYPAADFAIQMGGLVSFTGVRSLHRET
jgi:hypothetical protein